MKTLFQPMAGQREESTAWYKGALHFDRAGLVPLRSGTVKTSLDRAVRRKNNQFVEKVGQPLAMSVG